MGVSELHMAMPDLTDAEVSALREFWRVYGGMFDEIGAAIASRLDAHPELSSFAGSGDAADGGRARALIDQAILAADWRPFLGSMAETGARYAEAGLSFSAWFATARELRSRLTPVLLESLSEEPERLAEALRGLSIFIDLVMLAVGDSYIDAKERIIAEQQNALRDLSTPVLELRPALLLVPLIGLIDSERALLLTGQLLERISTSRAKAVVLDITGVPAVDSAVANHLMQTVQATGLMGAQTFISGLSAENAQTLVRLGLDLGRLNTVGTLADGVVAATAILSEARERTRRFEAVLLES